MKKLKTLFLLLVLTKITFAAGEILVYEIQFHIDKKIITGYISGNYWENNYEQFISDDFIFTSEFFNRYKHNDSLIVYTKLIDQTQIAEAVPFPMMPFFIDKEFKTYIDIDLISKVSLIKVWIRDAFGVNVLTEINPTDTLWMKKPYDVNYPLGDDPGCRLEIYSFNKNMDSTNLVNEFVQLYKKGDAPGFSEQMRKKDLLNLLKQRKIVVVELCGC